MGEGPDRFPVFPSIEPNVHFWLDVYSKYPTTKGLLHDSKNLRVVYGVIDLVAPGRYRARSINRKRIRIARDKYKKLLNELCRNPSTSNPEARRIADLFGARARPSEFRKARYRVRCQIGQSDRFRNGVIRSGAYLDEMMRIFRSHGLPEDLCYLPHVESSFNPAAYSKFGAAGIWQFTRSTGRQFMDVGYVLDERRDPIRSSKAAALLLKQNYQKLKSWPMAITAYNHGIAGMLRAKRRKGDYESIFREYRSRIFRFASRNFYSEFLAARIVAKNYRYYFGDLVLDQPVRTRNFTLKGYASLEDLSRYFEVDVTIIRRLNPSLRPPVFRGQKYVPDGYTLQLPQTADQARLDSFDETAPPFYKPQQKPSRYHRVRRGDTVGKIAKEHGLRVSDLIIANNLNSRGTIYVNQNLRLPVPDEQPAAPPNVQKKVAPLGKKKPIRTLSEEEIPVPELQSNPLVVAGHLQVERVLNEEGNRVGIIRVEVEETLGHYAEWLGIPTQRIRWLNAFPYGRSLKLHERIRIPLKKVSKEQFEEARFEYHQKIQEDFFNAYKVETLRKYRVKNGDNIWTLCNETFNLPLWLIRKYNPGVNFGDLRWSQELAIPVVEEMTENQTETG